jgi:hypothetical protein
MTGRTFGYELAGALGATGLALMLAMSGCATTVESTPEAVKAIESGGPRLSP